MLDFRGDFVGEHAGDLVDGSDSAGTIFATGEALRVRVVIHPPSATLSPTSRPRVLYASRIEKTRLSVPPLVTRADR